MITILTPEIEEKKTTKMKRPIYVYPEVIKARLPVFIRNDAATARRSRDPVILKLKQFDNNDLWAELIGDDLDPKWSYRHFVSLERNESTDNVDLVNPLVGMSIHAYAHSHRYHVLPQWWKESHRSIGGFGFKFENDTHKADQDGCTQWEGENQSDDRSLFKSLMFHNTIKDMKEEIKVKPEEESHHRWMPGHSSKAIKPDGNMETVVRKTSLHEAASEHKNIERIDVYHTPGTGRIAGLVFWDSYGATPLAWKQWEGVKPSNVKCVEHYPPRDAKYAFVGVMGDWTTDVFGNNKVLSRFSGIWRKV